VLDIVCLVLSFAHLFEIAFYAAAKRIVLWAEVISWDVACREKLVKKDDLY